MPTTQTDRAHPLLSDTPYASYVYGYPHKTAYRPFDSPKPLDALWNGEDRGSLFLYVHIPFCEMRCGFCNLFTTVDHRARSTDSYLDALGREVDQVAARLGDARFARMAVGGGTPTFLAVEQLARVFDLMQDRFGADCGAMPTSVETSPATASGEKLALLRERGVSRVSIGVQSFDEEDARRIGRPMRRAEMLPALGRIRDAGFPLFNIDLIYGGEGQTTAKWMASVVEAVSFDPEELYLYPLYVRPLTTLGKLDHSWDDQRLEAYRAARDYLVNAGYRQVSMRMFQKHGAGEPASSSAPHYCCQSDGMVGVGCGARSYTSAVHFSSEYAVGRSGVRAILDDYCARPAASFATAGHGVELDRDEQARRGLIMSLLQCDGLDTALFELRFGEHPAARFPELSELEALGLMVREPGRLRLTPMGIERSDSVGPWLYSSAIRRRMEAYRLR
ncbi:STM4012 family radical SAM protein [Phycisphaeraceae bacterium D3-23]